MELTEVQKRAASLIEDIQNACIKHGLNLNLYDGGIGFVDQESLTIVAVWRPTFMPPAHCTEDHPCA